MGIRIKPEADLTTLLPGFDIKDGTKIEMIASDAKYEFNFDHVLVGNSKQKEVFETTTKPIIDDVL